MTNGSTQPPAGVVPSAPVSGSLPALPVCGGPATVRVEALRAGDMVASVYACGRDAGLVAVALIGAGFAVGRVPGGDGTVRRCGDGLDGTGVGMVPPPSPPPSPDEVAPAGTAVPAGPDRAVTAEVQSSSRPDLATAVVLDHFQIGVRDLSDAELAEQAAEVAALPGGVADRMRRIVGREFDRRQPRATGIPAATVFPMAAAVDLPLGESLLAYCGGWRDPVRVPSTALLDRSVGLDPAAIVAGPVQLPPHAGMAARLDPALRVGG